MRPPQVDARKAGRTGVRDPGPTRVGCFRRIAASQPHPAGHQSSSTTNGSRLGGVAAAGIAVLSAAGLAVHTAARPAIATATPARAIRRGANLCRVLPASALAPCRHPCAAVAAAAIRTVAPAARLAITAAAARAVPVAALSVPIRRGTDLCRVLPASALAPCRHPRAAACAAVSSAAIRAVAAAPVLAVSTAAGRAVLAAASRAVAVAAPRALFTARSLAVAAAAGSATLAGLTASESAPIGRRAHERRVLPLRRTGAGRSAAARTIVAAARPAITTAACGAARYRARLGVRRPRSDADDLARAPAATILHRRRAAAAACGHLAVSHHARAAAASGGIRAHRQQAGH